MSLKNVLNINRKCLLSSTSLRKFCTFLEQFDPPYLESMKPKIPIYNTLNIQIKGYDYAILENCQKLVHKIAKIMDIDVQDAWATPAIQHKIQRFKPNSTIVDSDYVLCTYERNVQVADLPSTIAPLFFELIQAALPQNVNLSIHEHLEEHEKVRHVPDQELKQLKLELSDLTIVQKKK